MRTDKNRGIKMGKEVFYPISSNESQFVMEWTIEKGGGVPPHLHKYMDEKFVITAGELRFKMNGTTVIKKEGEEIFIPRNSVHSVKNNFKGQSSATVTYSPSADTGKLFEIWSVLDELNPGKTVNMLKSFYVAHKLGFREFSTPQPAWIAKFLLFIVKSMAALLGWKKLIDQFKELSV